MANKETMDNLKRLQQELHFACRDANVPHYLMLHEEKGKKVAAGMNGSPTWLLAHMVFNNPEVLEDYPLEAIEDVARTVDIIAAVMPLIVLKAKLEGKEREDGGDADMSKVQKQLDNIFRKATPGQTKH